MKTFCKHSLMGGGKNSPAAQFAKGTFFSLLLISACTAFTACNDDAEDSPVLASNKLNITVGLQQPQGRAIITGTTLPESSSIGVLLDDGEATSYNAYNNIKFTAATENSKQVWNPASDIVLDETKGTLYAYYPYAAGTNLTAIPVETASQTDYLYAEPVANVSEKNANVSVTMKHMLANVNVTVNKGTYVGTGNISKIAIQSDGFATGGTFNAAQETPAYTATTGAGTAIESNAATTLGGTATDIMVVPTGAAKPITFTATIDDVDYTVTSSDVTLENGNSYEYTLSLNSTFMSVTTVSIKEWTGVPKESLTLEKKGPWDIPNGVYAVSKDGKPVAVDKADETCVAVALVVNDAPVPQMFMIAKKDASNDGSNYNLYYDNDKGDLSLTNYSTADGTNSYGYLGTELSDDFTTWTEGALSDFNGKTNTQVIAASSSNAKDMCKVLETFNAGTNSQSNEGHNDWYVPACGQLALMYLAKTDINAALAKIGGTAFESNRYWSSSEYDANFAWNVYFLDGNVSGSGKSNFSDGRVRFVRDI